MKKLAWLIILVSMGSLFFSCEEESGEEGPGCRINYPYNGDQFFRGSTIEIEVNGGIDTYQVHFYVDDSLIHSSDTINFGYVWYYEWIPIKKKAGNHTIRAEAFNDKGIMSSDEKDITLIDGETEARFYANQILILPGTEIQFNDVSIEYPTTWQWDFGDGKTSTLQNPTHTYQNEGVYNVSLTVSNTAGSNKLSRENYITVTNDNVITDIEGNVYKTVAIGTQVWMKDNLKTTKLNDGTLISLVPEYSEWINLTTPGYCWLYNEEYEYGHKNYFGALYNWYAVETEKLCPEGWHVPTRNDWNNLFSYLGGMDIAGGKMKRAGTDYWRAPNTGATNESGFDALPGGIREQIPGGDDFGGGGQLATFWSSYYNYGNKIVYFLYAGEKYIFASYGDCPSYGVSVRCIKD